MAKDGFKVEFQIGADNSDLAKKLEQSEKYARDTKKKIDQSLKHKLELDIATYKHDLQEAKDLLKEAKFNDNKDAVIALTIKTDQIQRGITESKRQLNNLINTGDSMKSRLGSLFDSVGTKASSVFKGIASSFAGLFAIGSIGSFFKNVDEARTSLSRQTGATGEDLKSLQSSVLNVFKGADESITEVSEALATVYQRFKLTGEGLEDLTGKFLDFSDVNGGEVKDNVQLISRYMQDANIPTEQAGRLMDILTVATQKTGVSLSKLLDTSTTYGVQLRTMGFSQEQSIALLSKFEAEGVSTEKMMSGLSIALGRFAQKGIKDPAEAFGLLIEKIQGAKDVGDATRIAIEYLGAKAGPDFALAVKEGRFAIEDYVAALQGAEGQTEKVAQESESATEKFHRLGHALIVGILPAINAILEKLKPLIDRFTEFSDKNPKTATSIGYITIAVGLLGASLLALGGPVTAVLAFSGLLITMSAKLVSSISDISREYGYWKKGLKDVNGNLTEAGKQYLATQEKLRQYKLAVDSARMAQDAFAKTKVNQSATRAEFEATRAAAINATNALIAMYKSLIAVGAKQQQQLSKLPNIPTVPLLTGSGPLANISKLTNGNLLTNANSSLLSVANKGLQAEEAKLKEIEAAVFKATNSNSKGGSGTLPSGNGGGSSKKKVDEELEITKDAYTQAQNIAVDAYGKINDAIDNSKKKVEGYGDEIKKVGTKFQDTQKDIVKSITDINVSLGELNTNTERNLKDRYVEVNKQLSDLQKKQTSGEGFSAEESQQFQQLAAEKEKLAKLLTAEEIKQAEAAAKLSETEKILLEDTKQRSALLERRAFLESLQSSTFDESTGKIKSGVSGFKINDDLTATYTNSEGELIKINDIKNAQFAAEQLQKQQTLADEVAAIQTKQAEEQKSLEALNEVKKRLEDDYLATFKSSIEQQKKSVNDYFNTWVSGINTTSLSMSDLISKTTEAIRLQNQLQSAKSMAGFASGGYTGKGGKYDVAGVVHKGERVAPAWMMNGKFRPIIDSLEKSRQRGFASGGFTSSTDNSRTVTQHNKFDIRGGVSTKDIIDYLNWRAKH